MILSHINVTMPKGSEAIARSFYNGLLGLREMGGRRPAAAFLCVTLLAIGSRFMNRENSEHEQHVF